MILGEHVKRLNSGCISSVLQIGLVTNGSTSAWVTCRENWKQTSNINGSQWQSMTMTLMTVKIGRS